MAKATKKTKKAVEVEELDDDLELEELDEDVEEEEEAPAKKAKKTASKREPVKFGASDLAALISEETGQDLNARGLRVLLRKMARDGRLDREVTADNRTRYSWSGPNDPEVKAILKAIKSGELEEEKQAALEKLKKSKAKDATPKPAAKATKKSKKAKPAPEPEEDDEDIEFEDEDDE